MGPLGPLGPFGANYGLDSEAPWAPWALLMRILDWIRKPLGLPWGPMGQG